MGVCAKQMDYGDVAWRCMDCEKDPTCIICSECFEKGDHTGHRVQLKRNVGGCCDCGDPDAWDPEHFCSDHKGYDQSPEEILSKLPAKIRDAAEFEFEQISISLKKHCMMLQNFTSECLKHQMSSDSFKKTIIQIIHLIFKFLAQRVEEVPSFLHIICPKLNSIFIEKDLFTKNESHVCCMRSFVTPSKEAEFNL